MTTHHTAQGLASLGRHGDTMLVHMSPHEVAGLNYLAKKQGGGLTINPDTGLPEAFSLGGFFKGLLPMFAGALTGGAGMPLWAGIAAGAATGAATSKDPLVGALTGGMGGYGGFGLGKGFAAAAGVPEATNIAASTPGVVGSTGEIGSSLLTASKGMPMGLGPTGEVIQGYTMNTGLQNSPSMMTNPNVMNAVNAQNTLQTSGFTGAGVDKGMIPGMENLGGSAGKIGTGVQNIFTNKPGAWDAFKSSFVEKGAKPISDLAAYGKIGMPIGGAALSGLEPSDIYGEPIKPSDKDKYDPYATLNLSGDTGLRLVAEGGYIDGKGYAVGGVISNPSVGGGISDLYNRPEGQALENISQDGYGIGRLNTLASQESLHNAKTLGYAMGGPVSFADGGDAMKLQNETTNVDDSMGLGALTPPTVTSPVATGQTIPASQVQNTAAPTSSDSGIITQVATKLQQNPNYQPQNPIEAAIVKQIKGTDQQGQVQQGLGSLAPAQPAQPMAPTYNASQAITPTYYAGLNAPRGYAEGGYLDGAGDGMSDSIPATIEGQQPARLADGEFVVPADVVSHIGNGSSKAGSQRLYSMLDRVRKARTGTKKQGKQIKPEKYMPA